jgi:micrococcal nuclease
MIFIMLYILRIIALFILIALPVVTVADAAENSGTVRRVIDGDTLEVVTPSGKVERVRVIGLDTPEIVDPRRPVQCFGLEASTRAKELLPVGSTVTLQDDPTQDARDRYGRLLAHVILGTEDGGSPNFAVRMVSEGFATHYVYRVPSVWAAELAAAQANAQANAIGLWSSETCNGQVYPKRDLEEDGGVPASMAIPVGAGEDVAPSTLPSAAPEFDARAFIGRGNTFNCDAFANQAQAQAVLRADSTDPNRLDPDRDGLACEALASPRDLVPVKR